MSERDYLAKRFEEHRTHLRAVAYRMLGSLSDVDDAVQEAWLRLGRADATSIDNLGGWLTTVVARVCLDMLRSRTSRREEPFTPDAPEPAATGTHGSSPEQEALLADSVGLALLVVLDRLTPAERLAFVLHDMFAMPFEEIAPIVGRSAEATRQLASRARRRVRGAASSSAHDLVRQREVVDAFLAALRGGDFEGLIAVLDPDLVVRTDLVPPGAPAEVRGAAVWAKQAVAFAHLARLVRPALVDGAIGVVMAGRADCPERSPSRSRTARSPRSRSSAIRRDWASWTSRSSTERAVKCLFATRLSHRHVVFGSSQTLLALLFLFAGVMKLVLPIEKMEGPIALPLAFLRFIGVAETLGAFGLILPGLLRDWTALTSLAASGLMIIMIGATAVTARGMGVAPALFPLIVGLVAAIIAHGRRHPQTI